MNASPLVSILIPCCNNDRWVTEAVQSCLDQTYVTVEIIVVDDGSTDGSVKVLQAFGSSINLITGPNRGGGAARNSALRASSGEFIQYLDADDLLDATKIEEQVHLLRSGPPGLLSVCDWVSFRDGTPPASGTCKTGWPMVDSDDPLAWLIDLLGPDGQGSMVPVHSWLAPRFVLEAAGPWDEKLQRNQDGEYFARVVLHSTGIRRSGPGRCYYRRHPGGVSVIAGTSDSRIRSSLLALDSMREQILMRTTDEKARRALAAQYMGIAIAAYPTYPNVADLAERRARDLGFGEAVLRNANPRLGGLGRFIGWRAARRVGLAMRLVRLR